LLARVDLVPLRTHPLARHIAYHTIKRVEESIWEWESWSDELIRVKYPDQVVGIIGAALAVFDLDHALAFIERAYKHKSMRWHTLGKEEALLNVADTVAHFDLAGALGVIDRIEGYHQHMALCKVVERVSHYSYEQALKITDNIDAKYSRTKAAL